MGLQFVWRRAANADWTKNSPTYVDNPLPTIHNNNRTEAVEASGSAAALLISGKGLARLGELLARIARKGSREVYHNIPIKDKALKSHQAWHQY